MKKLKKGLSLLLVLAMMLALASNAFAWDTKYADNDTIAQKEAVAVMSGMGIINGMGDNNFEPAGKFTREQAAKIVAYMLAGPTRAQALTCEEDPFEDVPATKWSARYIAYADVKGIVCGYGDGKFGPTDTLTRDQWLKMLLVTLGYDAKEYGLEGRGWAINAQELALDIGLVSEEELAMGFNRDVAVLYAFNAMNTAPNGKKLTYVVNGITFDSVSDAALYVLATKGELTLSDITVKNTFGQLSVYKLNHHITEYNKYGELVNPDGVVADEFGRPQEKWTYTTGNKETVQTLEPIAVYTNEEVDLSKALKDIADKVEITGDPACGGAGSVVEAYLTAKYEEAGKTYASVAYVEIATYVAVVPKIQKDAKEVTLSCACGVEATTKDFAGLKEGDVVSFNVTTNHEAVNVTVLEGTKAKITATAKDYIRIDGTKAVNSKHVNSNGIEYKAGAEAVFYYDSFGNVLFVTKYEEPKATVDGYVYVEKSQAKAAVAGAAGDLFADGTAGKDAAARAQVVDLTSAEHFVVDLAIAYDKDEGKWHYVGEMLKDAEVVDSPKVVEPGIYGYYLDENGNFELAAAELKKVTLKQGVANTDAGYATSATKVTIVTHNDTAKVPVANVETITGYANFPKEALTADALVFADEKTKKVTEIIIYTDDVKEPEVKPVETTYAIFVGEGEKTADSTEYNFVVDGEAKTVVSKTALVVEAGKVYNLEEGETVKAAPIEAQYAGTVTVAEPEYIVVDEAQVDLKDVVIVDNKKYEAASIAEGDTVAVYGEYVKNVFVAKLIIVTPKPAEDVPQI